VDTFGFNVAVQLPHTWRCILSFVSSVYDLLGLASPFILPAKVLLHDLCRENLDETIKFWLDIKLFARRS
jgi:hypothetical protein